MPKNIIWLSSYPKSGNTWFRIILANLLGEKELDINSMEKSPIASARSIVEHFCGFDSRYFTHDEIDKIRPMAGDLFAKKQNEVIFRKNHDAYTFLEDGTPMLGNPELYKTIYIIRNPLSIVASLANHNNSTIDEAIEKINKEDYGFCVSAKTYTNQLRQKLFSWSGHVNSWINQKGLDLITIKYEDMHCKPLATLKSSLSFAGLKFSDEEILEAIEKSAFDKVTKLEDTEKFRETPLHTEKFFRSGKTDSWKNELTPKQAKQVVLNHWNIMEQFGYLTDEVLEFTDLSKKELKFKEVLLDVL